MASAHYLDSTTSLGTPSWWNDEFLKTMADSSGLVHRYAAFGVPFGDPTYPDVGIMSRFPLFEPEIHGIPGAKKILDVKIAGPGGAHRFLATHFTPKGDRARAQPERMESAFKVRELIATSPSVVLGGDLNFCPPVPASEASGPLKDECNGVAAEGLEYNMLTRNLTDAFRAVPGSVHCSNARVDYVMFRGIYKAVSYDTCSFGTAGEPSDHPYVLVTLEFVTSPRPPRPPCPAGQKCCEPEGAGCKICVPKNAKCP